MPSIQVFQVCITHPGLPSGIVFDLRYCETASSNCRFDILFDDAELWADAPDVITGKLPNNHLGLITNTIRQVLITLQKYRLSVVDFSVHRFFAILENGDEVLRSFCAVDVRRKRRFQLRAGLANFNGLFATENLLALVRLDTDKNSLAHFTTSGGSSSGAQNFTAP